MGKKNKKRDAFISQQKKPQNNNAGVDIGNLASMMMGNNFADSSKTQKKTNNSDRKKSTNTRNSNTTVTSNGGIMAFAPYNFVPFTKKVHSLKADKQISHAIISEELYSGVIEYEIEAKTPIFVDNGKGEFHKNQYGNYSIPGSTMRGLIRSNVQVLGLASMNDDVDDYPSTIKKGMPTVHITSELDYAKSIFGYVDKKKSYKSKVSFSDALVMDSVSELEERKYILGEPSPTCYMNYLEQDEYGTTYNSDEFYLRGMKQYWLKNEVIPLRPPQQLKNEGVLSILTPLSAHTKFRGKVRYHNLTKEELGLLLWSIRLEENSWMNLGKAKAYGYGAVKIDIISAKNVDIEKAYSMTEFYLSPYKDIEVDEMIDIYKTSINKTLKEQKIDNLLSIKAFFAMKDAGKILDKSKTVYMSLDEYKQKNVLPKVKDLVE